MMKILVIDKTSEMFKEKLISNKCIIIENLIDPKEKILKNFDFDGIVLRSRFSIDSKFINKVKGLKFIARYGSGMEHIDVQTAKENNIVCLNCPEGNKDAVAEHAIGQILCLFNKINSANDEIKNGLWNREKNRGIELMNKTIGVIGYGNTGQSFCEKLNGFKCNILVFDKYKNNFGNDFIREASMDELQKNADILSLHIPLNKETENMVNLSFLLKFKKPVYLINTSRGKIINTNDLVLCLKKKIVMGACLDVIEYEENSFERINNNNNNNNMKFLIKAENVILTPHIAGLSFESKKRLSKILANKILDFIKSIN